MGWREKKGKREKERNTDEVGKRGKGDVRKGDIERIRKLRKNKEEKEERGKKGRQNDSIVRNNLKREIQHKKYLQIF